MSLPTGVRPHGGIGLVGWGAGAVGSFPRASLLHLRYKFPGLVFGSQVPGESPVLPSPGGTDLQSLGDQLSFYRRGSETEGAM